MSEVGWCPTSLYDMPITKTDRVELETQPEVTQDLDLVGIWTRICLNAVAKEVYNWRGVHPLIKEQPEFHIYGEERCFLLSKPLSKSSAASIERAILGKERDRHSELPCYEFIRAVYFSPVLIKNSF